MNTRKPGWHSQLAVTGIGQPINHSGSIMEIIAEILKDLHGLNPRTLSEGHKEIVIRIRDTPYSANKTESDMERTLDVLAHLDVSTESGGPREGESADQFYFRLITEGTPEQAANTITNAWFPRT